MPVVFELSPTPVQPPSALPPAAPALSLGTVTTNSVPLTWSQPPRPGSKPVAFWTVYRNGIAIATQVTQSFTDTGLTPNTPYWYWVIANDTQSPPMVSNPSNTVATTTLPQGGGYVFTLFIAPVPPGNDANDGSSPTQGAGTVGPWTIGSLLNSQTINLHPTAKQQANNAAMAGQVVGIVGDQGIVSLTNAGITYPTVYGGNGNVLSAPSGTIAAPTILASCNSLKQYVPRLAILDGGLSVGTFLNGLNTTNIISSFDFIGRSDLGTNCQYITIDGLTIQNCANSAICFRISAPGINNEPGWVAINNLVRNVYNCNEGFQANGVSQTGTTLTIGSIVRGVVHVGNDGDIVLTAAFAPTQTKITAQLSGTPGGAGTYTSTYNAPAPIGPVNGFIAGNFSGNNLAGISFHGGLNFTQVNNFIQDVVDLNDLIPNNFRSLGIKNWVSNGGTVQFNTIYASAATGQPVGGIAFKNVPQFNYTIAQNYINLGNATLQGTDCVGIACDGEASSTVTSPNGHFATVNNNIIVCPLNAIAALPVDAGGGNTQALLINFFNNTMIGPGNAHANFARNGPTTAGNATLTYHDNIQIRTTPAAAGNGGDWRTQVTNVISIGFNVWPPNYVINTIPTAGGSGTVYQPGVNGGLAGAMASLVAGGAVYAGAASDEVGTPTFVGASLTNFVVPASQWDIAPTSPVGYKTGTGGNNKGAFGGVTRVGCDFKDPSG